MTPGGRPIAGAASVEHLLEDEVLAGAEVEEGGGVLHLRLAVPAADVVDPDLLAVDQDLLRVVAPRADAHLGRLAERVLHVEG